jgi:hypothetical protein
VADRGTGDYFANRFGLDVEQADDPESALSKTRRARQSMPEMPHTGHHDRPIEVNAQLTLDLAK